MRRLPAILLLLVPVTAAAEQTGGESGGGRLGQVSGGIRDSGGGGSRGGGGGTQPQDNRPTEVVIVYSRPEGETATTAAALGRPVKPRYDGGRAKLEVYLGAQKVVDSDGSWTAEVALRDGLFRLGGQITRYYERQADDSNLRVTIPSLIGGVRVDDRGPTQAFLEFGLVGLRTQNDPVMDSSLGGAVGGVRVEHALSRNALLTTEIHEMIFEDDIRAHSARVGLRSGPIQASFRILDFNVGPALYGPELGLRF